MKTFSISLLLVLCNFFISFEAFSSGNRKCVKCSRMLQEVSQDKEYIFPIQYQQKVHTYTLDVELFPFDRRIIASAEIEITPASLTDSIILNFYENLSIDSLFLDNTKTTYSRLPRHLIVKSGIPSLEKRLLKVYYQGTPLNLGFSSFTFGSINKNSLVYTINEPYFASTWFPCNDIPSSKAIVQISVTNDTGYTSLSNGKLISEQIKGRKKVFTWKTMYPIAPYLMTIYSSRYEKESDSYTTLKGEKVPVEYYSIPKHTAKAIKDFEDHPKMMKVFSQLFGEYPFVQEKYAVAEFLWQAGAMENQTITGIGSNFITGNKLINDILSHELAHHWWGNAVSPKTWDDIWLNEGFSTYSEALYIEQTEGKEAFLRLIESWDNGYYPDKVYAPQDDIFSNSVYKKGALILHALRGELSDTVFFQVLRAYFEKYKYNSASVKDFQIIAEQISGKELGLFFNQWLYNEGEVPSLNVDWHGQSEKNTAKLVLTQLQNTDIYTFDVNIRIEGKNEKQFLTQTVHVDRRKVSITISAPFEIEKIIPDPDLYFPGTVSITEI